MLPSFHLTVLFVHCTQRAVYVIDTAAQCAMPVQAHLCTTILHPVQSGLIIFAVNNANSLLACLCRLILPWDPSGHALGMHGRRSTVAVVHCACVLYCGKEVANSINAVQAPSLIMVPQTCIRHRE